MAPILTIVLLALAVFYALCLLWIVIGLCRLKTIEYDSKPKVSIIVAARNEENNIQTCIHSLVSQDYPPEKREIIIVDDRSEDNTAKIIENLTKTFSEVKLIKITERSPNMAPKKYALDYGIRNSTGEILFTTDADCQPGPKWISDMVSQFSPETGLIAGFSPVVRGPKFSLMRKLLELDSLALAAVSAGSIGMHFPLTCSGRNIAYRKEVYEQVQGFETIREYISGDDDLFLQLVRDKTNWGIRYSKKLSTLVPCVGPSNLRQFKEQRTRHASKGLYYKPVLRAILILVYLFNVLILFSLPFFVCKALTGGTLLLVFMIKITFEFLVISFAAILFHKLYLLRYFPIAAMAHIPYVVLFAALGSRGKFVWKDESSHYRGVLEGNK